MRGVFCRIGIAGWVVGWVLMMGMGVVEAGVDVGKKKEPPRIIKPETSRYRINKKYQAKRYPAEIVEAEKIEVQQKLQPGENLLKPQADAGVMEAAEEALQLERRVDPSKQRIEAVVANASKDFREAYQEALRIELEKRAVEIERRRQEDASDGEVTQDDINRYSQVQRGREKPVESQAAGGKAGK